MVTAPSPSSKITGRKKAHVLHKTEKGYETVSRTKVHFEILESCLVQEPIKWPMALRKRLSRLIIERIPLNVDQNGLKKKKNNPQGSAVFLLTMGAKSC
jgi:hypothetical protein